MGDWIPLMDYAIKKGVSLSTLRRHIKAKKIPYKIESGRYLLLDEEGDALNSNLVDFAPPASAKSTSPKAMTAPQPDQAIALHSALNEVERLSLELQKAQEEIAELKTLIALYEEKMFRQPQLNV